MNNETFQNNSKAADKNSDYSVVRFPDFSGTQTPSADSQGISLSALSDVTAEVRAEIGRTEILLSDVIKLMAGSVVKLSKPVGEKTDLVINSKIIAHGDIVSQQSKLSLKITDLVL